MKIAEACLALGHTEEMYCFAGRDESLENTLCLECIRKLAEDCGYELQEKEGNVAKVKQASVKTKPISRAETVKRLKAG